MPHKLIVALILGAASVAAAADVYTIPVFVIAPGGVNVSSSACFSLSGAAGQPVVGATTSADYEIQSGFWAALNATQDRVFSNGFESCNS